VAVIGKHDKYWDIHDQMPEGWVVDRNTKSPLAGHVFINNNQAGRHRKHALLRTIKPERNTQQTIFGTSNGHDWKV